MVQEYEWTTRDDGMGMYCHIPERAIRMAVGSGEECDWWAVYKNGERVDGGEEATIGDCMALAEDAADQLI